ncbi:hypothetical protein KUTeg_017092 [Tegillarca granosa]|uniref:Non-structural maintenance of chromosomes element 1 homolog n=1 Tax=Tegillarca granosa TaxID=220873 RepID=A0ABQ9EMQ1_TEGGR|nr:hypothetical protein KUTeg_017092 [Tegillarca granosa]
MVDVSTFLNRGGFGIKGVSGGEYYPDSENERKNHLLELVQTINRFIHPFHMEIKKGVGEEDGVSYYCLVCTNESAITKLASDYSPNELEYFKKLTSGRVSLSTRSLLELEQYILDLYEDSTSCRCNACKHICLKNQILVRHIHHEIQQAAENVKNDIDIVTSM